MLQIIYDFNEINVETIATIISKNLKTSDVILLTGDLGAGKTHLIKVICWQINRNIEISSPTFGIYNQYKTKIGTIWHYDLYRIEDCSSGKELQNLDLEEAMENGMVFVEWANKINFPISENTLLIDISHHEENHLIRKYKISFLEKSKWREIFIE